jgi:hypothetical protein
VLKPRTYEYFEFKFKVLIIHSACKSEPKLTESTYKIVKGLGWSVGRAGLGYFNPLIISKQKMLKGFENKIIDPTVRGFW